MSTRIDICLLQIKFQEGQKVEDASATNLTISQNDYDHRVYI